LWGGGNSGGHVTESQNGWGWKGPLWVTQSNPLPKQGHPEMSVHPPQNTTVGAKP